MNLSTNTHFIDNTNGLKGAVDIIAGAGFDAIDFSQFSSEYYTDTHSKDFYTEIKKYAHDKGLYFNQAHAPFPSSNPDPLKTKSIFTDITTAMKNASYLGVRNIIVHPCQHLSYYESNNKELLFEMNMEFYNSLIPYCEEYGINVAIENMWQTYRGIIVNSTCSTPEEMIRYIDTLNSKFMVGCLDIGHSALVRIPPDEFIKSLGNKRLQALHIHDNDACHDSHTMPYLGILNWNKIMNALDNIKYEGEFTFESDSFIHMAPDNLIPDYEKLLAKTGRFLISKTNL